MNLKKYLPWFIAFLYFVNPYDVIPDFAFGPGWIDDLIVVGLAFWWASRFKRAYQTRRASAAYAGTGQRQHAEKENSPEKSPYEILGLESGASKEEIRAAYKELASRYHPDKVQHLGKEFQDLAHKKFVAIQEAYDTLIKTL